MKFLKQKKLRYGALVFYSKSTTLLTQMFRQTF